ncbi:MAG: AAA family ATPase, partial [Lachnospiraceae bacterium]|nr:AAA family ATPase [Lachnospiraceae bacterium]
MEQLFITNLTINKVRHLENISIPLSENRMKHLILTGKNGSGKTSVVEALMGCIQRVFRDERFGALECYLADAVKRKNYAIEHKDKDEEIKYEELIHEYEEILSL